MGTFVAPTILKRSGGTIGLSTDTPDKTTKDLSGSADGLKTSNTAGYSVGANGQMTSLSSSDNPYQNGAAANPYNGTTVNTIGFSTDANGKTTPMTSVSQNPYQSGKLQSPVGAPTPPPPAPVVTPATTPTTTNSNNSGYVTPDMLRSAQGITREMLSGSWADSLKTANTEATARNMANQRAATAQQLSSAGLSTQGIGAQAAQGIEQQGLQAVTDTQLKNAQATNEAKLGGIDAMQNLSSIETSNINNGMKKIDALIAAGGEQNYAAAAKEFANVFPGTNIDFGRLVTAEKAGDFSTGMKAIGDFVAAGSTNWDAIPQAQRDAIKAQTGMDDYQAELMFNQMVSEADPTLQEINSLKQSFGDAWKPEYETTFRDAILKTKLGELGYEMVNGVLTFITKPVEDRAPKDAIVGQLYATANGDVKEVTADGEIPVDISKIDAFDSKADNVLKVAPKGSNAYNDLIKRRADAFINRNAPVTAKIDTNTQVGKDITDIIKKSKGVVNTLGNVSADTEPKADKESMYLSAIKDSPQGTIVEIAGDMYSFDSKSTDNTSTGYNPTTYFFNGFDGSKLKIEILARNKHSPTDIPKGGTSQTFGWVWKDGKRVGEIDSKGNVSMFNQE
jgi:hypothetical protein